MIIRTTITTARKTRGAGLPALVRRVERAQRGPKAVKVGFPRGNVRPDIVQIAIWNHFGTKGGASGGGWGGPIPPRPFITLAVWNNRRALRTHIRAAALRIVRGEGDVRVELGRLGVYATGLIQKQIADGVPPPNSPITIRMKGSSKPLIDTGRMRGAITWDIA